jgi:hypothetical protein
VKDELQEKGFLKQIRGTHEKLFIASGRRGKLRLSSVLLLSPKNWVLMRTASFVATRGLVALKGEIVVTCELRALAVRKRRKGYGCTGRGTDAPE